MLADPVPFAFDAIDAVVFDMGGVFMVRHPESVGASLAAGGFDAPPAGPRWVEAHYQGVRALTDLLASGPVAESDPGVWVHFDHAYLRTLGFDGETLEAARIALRDNLYAIDARPWRYLLDDNVKAFHRLAASGVPVAVVSNNDGSASAQLEDMAIAQVGPGPLTEVVTVVDSGVIGIAKPDPAIFAPALKALGTSPARTLYVGDTVHADVLGATRAGMPVVQLDPLGLHAAMAHTTLPGISEIADGLGI